MHEPRVEKKHAFTISNDEAIIRRLAEIMAPVATTHGLRLDSQPETLIQQLSHTRPALLLVDTQAGGETALSLVHHVRRALPEATILLLGAESDPDLIIQGFRAGIADFLLLTEPDGLLRMRIEQALERTSGEESPGEVYSIFSMPGGHGVTTLAIHLAESIAALSKRRTLLADMNLYLGNVASTLECDIACTPFDLVKELPRLDDSLLFSVLTQHPTGFLLLGNDSDAQDADAISGDEASRLFIALRAFVDHIIVDLPHDLTPRTTSILDQSDVLLLLAQQSAASLRSAQGMLALCEELGFKEEKVKLIVNRFLPRHALGLKEIEDVLRHPVYMTLPNDFARVAEAQNHGSTLGQMAPGSKLFRRMEELAARLTGLSPVKSTHGWTSLLRGGRPARART